MKYNSIKFVKQKRADVLSRALRRSFSGKKLLKLLFWRKRRRRHKAAIFIFNTYDFGGQKFKRRKLTRYARLVIEKQKLRAFYSVLTERQIKSYLKKASKLYPTNMSGRSLIFDVFFSLLEARLDIAVFRLHFAKTILESRQLVSHKKIKVNGRIVNKGGYLLSPGDIVEITGPEQKRVLKDLFERVAASDSGMRRFRVGHLLRKIFRKWYGLRISFKGGLLNFFDASFDAKRSKVNSIRFDTQVTMPGNRPGAHFLQRISYDSVVQFKSDKTRLLNSNLIIQAPEQEMNDIGLYDWRVVPLYLDRDLFFFFEHLNFKETARWFLGVSLRWICGRNKFRAGWYWSRRFKRRGKFRRRRFYKFKHLLELSFMHKLSEIGTSKGVPFALENMYKFDGTRRRASTVKPWHYKRYKRTYRRSLSKESFRLLQKMFFGHRRSRFGYTSFPVLFPVPRMYEVDYSTGAGVYVGSYSYENVPFTAHLKPYLFYQFYLKSGF